MTDRFQLVSPYSPAGDQPQAIEKLVQNFEAGLAKQTLLGVTGSGKTLAAVSGVDLFVGVSASRTSAMSLVGPSAHHALDQCHSGASG